MILALLAAIYEAAIERARAGGPLDPRLYLLMDEAANIAPVRNLASWLSQCGDHGILIATIWQSIAQIDQRYGRAARDAICAASTAQIFIPPLADPTSAGYLSELLGEEPVANASPAAPAQTLSVSTRRPGRRRGCGRSAAGRAILIYRDLPPAIVSAPGWFEDPRFGAHRRPWSRRVYPNPMAVTRRPHGRKQAAEPPYAQPTATLSERQRRSGHAPRGGHPRS